MHVGSSPFDRGGKALKGWGILTVWNFPHGVAGDDLVISEDAGTLRILRLHNRTSVPQATVGILMREKKKKGCNFPSRT